MMSWKSIAIGTLMAMAVAGAATAQQAAPDQSGDQAVEGGVPRTGPGMMGPGMMGLGGATGGAVGPWMMNGYGVPGTMGWHGYGGPQMMDWRGHGAFMCETMAGHIDGRLAFLKAELKITDAQESLWQHYADDLRNSAGKMAEHCAAMTGEQAKAALSLPERLKLQETFMAQQLDVLRAMERSLQPLYDALSAE
ncbi:Spy/CpxP family protein refolding chaperone [Dongia soli]|uniref:Spy/CpxP family protein refolding chaperone n=1 Tax=Dongia soli TaxID=600628 RepID=A0ABU5EGR1_9PROT|nr:Spy/CpxP family protein refolding chaperone [Dongia soli]MDY0885613.1 Spy/CpxP family protein refolding chaperone [Dongia soli]